MPYSTPLTFTSIIRSHSSILRRSSGDCGISPALLIITSMRPYACTAPSTSFFTCSLWMTSVGTASAFPPRRVSSSASASMRSARRAPSTTVAPCADNSRAVASPRPLLVPVMTTTFSLMLLLMWGSVLFVADLLHPVDDLTVEFFLDGNMGHRSSRRRAMPMLFARRARDHIAGPDDLDRAAPALNQPAAGSHNQCLAKRVRVPCAPGALNSWSIRTVPVTSSAGPLAEGCEPFRLMSICTYSLLSQGNDRGFVSRPSHGGLVFTSRFARSLPSAGQPRLAPRCRNRSGPTG